MITMRPDMDMPAEQDPSNLSDLLTVARDITGYIGERCFMGMAGQLIKGIDIHKPGLIDLEHRDSVTIYKPATSRRLEVEWHVGHHGQLRELHVRNYKDSGPGVHLRGELEAGANGVRANHFGRVQTLWLLWRAKKANMTRVTG